jgi:hypothetical protein
MWYYTDIVPFREGATRQAVLVRVGTQKLDGDDSSAS